MATPITYDEAVDGDLDDQTFTFDGGANVLEGSSFIEVNPFSNDSDPFFFIIQPGEVLQSAEVNFQNIEIEGMPISQLATFAILPQPFFFLPSTDVDLLSATSGDLFLEFLPLPMGTYRLFWSFAGTFPAGTELRVDADYTLTFNVDTLTSIPEPASIALFLLGLCSMVGLGLFGQHGKLDSGAHQEQPKAGPRFLE